VFYKTLGANSPLKKLLDGSVPNETWRLNRTQRLLDSYQLAMDQWQFVYKWFAVAKLNYRMPVPVMPTLAYISLIGGQVPSLSLAIDIITSSPLNCRLAEQRIYSCYTGWLRELHVGLYLAQFGEVTKNPVDDVSNGIDWLFNGKKIAVTRDGKASKRYIAQRKAEKTDQETIVLTARGSVGLALVDESEIDAKCLA
jgi:hypothetical protein